jgi:hypothetical protein
MKQDEHSMLLQTKEGGLKAKREGGRRGGGARTHQRCRGRPPEAG